MDLGLEPRWITVQEALSANEEVIAKGAQPWTWRETIILRLLAELFQQAGPDLESIHLVTASELLDY